MYSAYELSRSHGYEIPGEFVNWLYNVFNAVFCFVLFLQVSKSACILTTQVIMKLLKSKEAAAAVDIKTWPTILDTGTECLSTR